MFYDQTSNEVKLYLLVSILSCHLNLSVVKFHDDFKRLVLRRYFRPPTVN